MVGTLTAVRIGVVSDTHMPHFGLALPRALVQGLASAHVDRIIHCGDMTDLLIVALFEAIAPFDGVAGNNDGEPIKQRFGRRKVLDVAGARIGVVHGDGHRKTTFDRARAAFADDPVDAILFGHSHRPLCMRRDGTLFVNPGSPTDKRMNPRYSFATLDVIDGHVEAQLHYYLRRDI